MKRTSSAIIIAALSGTLAGPPAFPQSADFPTDDPFALDDAGALSWQADIGLVLLVGDTPSDDVTLLGDAELGVEFETFTDMGRRWGLVLSGRAERDLRPDVQGGRVGNCPAGSGDCATVGQPGAAASPIASDSGLYSAGNGSGDRVRGMISEAYVFMDTGWGEARVGYGPGAARLDPVGGPAAGRLVRADGGHLLAAPRLAIRTETVHSGHDPKLVFRSIALGQESTIGTFRLAASFTPEARQCGVDFCPRQTLSGGQLGAINENISELAVTWEVRRGEHEWAISLATSHAGRVQAIVGFEPISGLDAGLSWRWQDWRAGGRWRRSNNGVSGSGDYEAFSASLGWEQGDWLTTIEYAAYSDDFIHSDGSVWQTGASRLVGDHGLVAFGLQTAESREPQSLVGGRLQIEDRRAMGFVELGWRY